MRRNKAAFSFFLAMCITIMVGTIGIETCAALLAAVLVHECGHIAAIYLCGMKVLAIKPEPSGLKIIYSETVDCKAELLSALAGPVAGTVYYWLVRNAGGMWELSAQLSLLYTLFNMLPAKELDGGRILSVLAGHLLGEEEGRRLVTFLSILVCAAFLCFGVVCFLRGEGGGMFAAAIWLLMLHNGN